MPYIGPSGELKTKPTQHSVAALRSIGIQPDAVVCRADRELPDSIKRKISLMCDVDEEAVVTAADAPSIYDIPKVLHREGLDAYVVRRLDLPFRDVDWTTWDDLLRRVHHPKEEVTVALVGKYIDLHDAYLSVGEALRAGGFAHEAKVNIRWIPSDECESPAGAARHLSDVDAVCVPGGFGIRGIEGKLGALTYARSHGIPTLGLCLGLQCMVIEYARNVAGLEKAASTEFDPDCPEPVIATMEEQKSFVDGAGDLGGTMRLGLYPASLQRGSVVRAAYGADEIEERHRHRYEVNNAYRDQLEAAGMVFSGTNPDLGLVEFVELPRDVHPYYVATQAHPELRSRPTRPHPLFKGLVGAAIERQKELRFPIDETGLRREIAPRRASEHDDPESSPTATSSGRSSPAPTCTATTGSSRCARTPSAAPTDADGEPFDRTVLEHPGAVVVLAIDEQNRVLCLRQYRHAGATPVRRAARRAAGRAGGAPRARGQAGAARGGRPRGGALDAPDLDVLLARASPPRSSTSTSPAACGTSTAATSCRSTRRPTWRPSGCRSATCSTAVEEGRVADGPLVIAVLMAHARGKATRRRPER